MATQWKVMKDSVLNSLITSVNNALTQAQGSATAAAGSATTAAGHVTSAETARDAAQGHATAAGTSASNALTYRNAAQTAQGLAEGARDAAITARTGSESARDLSVAAKTASETARDASIAARNESQTARDASVTAKNESVSARDLSQKWANELENVAVTVGNYSSLHHAAKSAASATLATAEKNAAIAAKDLAVTARTGAETARDAAITAQGLSEGARDASVTAKNASEAARDLALQYRDTTLGYRNTAGTHATNAGNSATAASGHATTAMGYRDQALGYKNDAEAAAGLAIQGIHVISRLASTANYPATPSAGDAYVIENGTTLKDEIHLYDGSAWTIFSVGSGTAWGEISGILSSQTDLTSALAGKEPTFTKNTGFNKNFGTTAGTVAQGDDSRFTNSREWTASTVTQLEAETGTATTRRAWTAQRVHQASAAWWAGTTDKTKLDSIATGAQVNTVTSVAGKTGAVTVTKSDVGLGSVDNYSRSHYDGRYLGITAKAADSNLLDGIDSSGFLRSNTTDYLTGNTYVRADILNEDGYRDHGVYGHYNSSKINHIWSMGTAYRVDPAGANFGSLYGMAYKHTNNATGGTMAGGHQIVFCSAGTPGAAIGLAGGIWTSGTITGNGAGITGTSAFRATGTTKDDVGLSGIPNTNGSTANYLRGDGNWVTPPNTNTWRGIDDVPVNGQTSESITSNWAYDHVNAANPHGTSVSNLNGHAKGNWTPEHVWTTSTEPVQNGGTSPTFTGTYERIGDEVFCYAKLDFDDTASISVNDCFKMFGLPIDPLDPQFQGAGVGWAVDSISGRRIAIISVAVDRDIYGGSAWCLVTHVSGSINYTRPIELKFSYRA